MTTNRRILIDNATLSGVDRLTGRSQTINLNNVDNDILCLDKLVTAILFSDHLIGIDDYKSEFRSQRIKEFEFVQFSKIDPITYKKLAQDAAAFARGMGFSFEGSKPVGDVVSFFEALRVDPQLRWNVWVSSEYLALSFLVEDSKNTRYEHSIDSIFRTEDTDYHLVDVGTDYIPPVTVASRGDISDIKELMQAFASSNPNFAGSDSKSILKRMLFGYGWAAERSHFYNAVAEIEASDAYLAPLRDAFCESCCRLDFSSDVNNLIATLKEKSQDTISKILEPSGEGKFAIRLPFFVAYLISKTDNPTQCIDLALKLRDADEFRQCRALFHNLNYIERSNRIKEINRIFKYIEQSTNDLMKKYAVTTEGGMQFSISLGLTGLNLSANIKLNQLFRSYKNKPFARVFRNIAQDLVSVERLGGLHDKVCSQIRRHPDANYPQASATPRYMERRENVYGRPAKL